MNKNASMGTTEPQKGIPEQENQPVDMNQYRLRQKAEAEMAMLQKNQMVKEQIAQMPKKIGAKEVTEASQILQKYKSGKARLEQKIIANEEFWKLRQWNYMNDGKGDFKPATPYLWSCIQSRYSDAMDSYPTCNVKPRQKDDQMEAEKLTSIIPVVMEQNRFEETYSDVAWYTLKHGGGVYGIFWDTSKHNGLGDIAIRKVDFINLFWESGITNIQDSEHLFHTELVSNKALEHRYPQCVGKLGGQSVSLAKYLYDDQVDTTDKSVVVDWYYHTNYNGKKVLQYCKYVNDIVLYATENEVLPPSKAEIDPETGIPLEVPTGEAMATRGLYDHAQYPFVIQNLFPIEGSICGYGLTDIGRDTQIQIDLMNKAIVDNTVIGAKPRHFIKNNGGVNEEEYCDISKDLVHVEGSINDDNIRPIDTKQLDSIYVNVLQMKIEELKHATSSQDVTNGAVPSGVTAGSAISALQETAGKNARSSNKTFYRAYREVVYQVIELIRQFYDVPRTFRITGENGDEFVTYSNQNIIPQQQMLMGVDMGFRLPEFDIDVSAEKENPYKKMEMNELALNFYQQGFFNPQMADQALSCLEMMDFKYKEDIMDRIKQNGTLMQMLLQYQKIALQLATQVDPMLAEQIANDMLMQGGQPLPQGTGSEVNLDGSTQEHPYAERARSQARASTQVD